MFYRGQRIYYTIEWRDGVGKTNYYGTVEKMDYQYGELVVWAMWDYGTELRRGFITAEEAHAAEGGPCPMEINNG